LPAKGWRTLNIKHSRHWDDILRLASSDQAGTVTAFADAAQPRQLPAARTVLAVALRELGRISAHVHPRLAAKR